MSTAPHRTRGRKPRKSQHQPFQTDIANIVNAKNVYTRIHELDTLRFRGLEAILADLPEDESFRVVKHKLLHLALRDVLRSKQLLDELGESMKNYLAGCDDPDES